MPLTRPDRSSLSCPETEESVGYGRLLRSNANFRNLWSGQIISLLGDWFDTIAVFTLIFQLTHSAKMAGLLTLARFLPTVFVSPTAGVVADRVDRRRLLITTDLLRCVIVLGFLLVRQPEQLWIVYAVTILQFSVSSFFEPARSAILPSLVARRELVPANALSSVTWSAMLTLGAAVGGVVTNRLGVRAAFVIDSGTFLASACFLFRIRMPQIPPRPRRPFSWRRTTGWDDLREGIRYLKRNRGPRGLLFIKPAWSLSSGGMVLLLAMMGDRTFRIGRDASAGMSLLYSARGIGTALGPMLTRRLAGNDPVRMRRAIGPAFGVAGGFYLVLSAAPTLPIALLATLLAHMGGSVLWVFSSVMLQQEVPAEFRGRVFATEAMAQTLTLSLSTALASASADLPEMGIRRTLALLALLGLLSGALWEGKIRRVAAPSRIERE